MQRPKSRNNAVFDIRYHLVLVTKYRRNALSSEMREHLRMMLAETLEKWRCELIEFGGESDHIHLLFLAHPALDFSKLVNNLKTVSSRLLRSAFAKEVRPFYWKRSYGMQLLCRNCGEGIARNSEELRGEAGARPLAKTDSR